MSYVQAQKLEALVSSAFPWADEVHITKIFNDEEMYFVALWWNQEVVTTFRDMAKFEHFLAFMAKSQLMEVTQ